MSTTIQANKPFSMSFAISHLLSQDSKENKLINQLKQFQVKLMTGIFKKGAIVSFFSL